MARPLRIEYPGAIYHVTFRGNERRLIFKSDSDRKRFLQKLALARDLYQARIFLVCLMPNHVHLLMETPQGNLSAFMGQLLTAYTVYFNRRHRRVGHLTQGRYQARVVEGDNYLLKLSRYVHLNPVNGRGWQGASIKERRESLRAYRWSTFRSYAGREKPWPWIEYAPLLAMLTDKDESPSAIYATYVELGLAESDEAFSRIYRESRLGVGSPSFIADLHDRYQRTLSGRHRREDAAMRKQIARRPREEVLLAVVREFGVEVADVKERRRHSWLRAAAAWALLRHAGLSQRTIAAILGVGTGAAVSLQLRKWLKAVNEEPQWKAVAAAIDRRLQASR